MVDDFFFGILDVPASCDTLALTKSFDFFVIFADARTGGLGQDLMIFPAKEFHISEKVTRNGGKHDMERASTSPGGLEDY